MSMEQTLLTLEKQFFDLQYMSDEDWLNRTIHDDFIECGKSGYLSDKVKTIQALLACKENRKIEIYNYAYFPIHTNCYIVHYITKMDTKYYYRTSIWVKNQNLQLLFHQASELKEETKLILY